MKHIPFAKPYFPSESRKNILQSIDKILASGQLMMGEYTKKFEADFSSYVGTSHAVTTNSCTTALQICLQHFGVSGFEVIVPAASFITDISAVHWSGGIPVLVDISPSTLSFDLNDLKNKITERTKGIIWVHLTGQISSDWLEIVRIARQHNLFLIEDCAHAHGASVDGKKAGSIGDAGCFSFFPTKLMTTGTGGIICTNDGALEKTARELRLFGRENGTGVVIREGNDWFLDEIRACLGYHQLKSLDEFVARRREIARLYDLTIEGANGIHLYSLPSGNLSSYYHYTIYLDDHIDAVQLVSILKEKYGIPTKQIYIPLHKEAIFKKYDCDGLNQTEKVLDRSLCLPIYVEMTDDDVIYVAKCLLEVLPLVANVE